MKYLGIFDDPTVHQLKQMTQLLYELNDETIAKPAHIGEWLIDITCDIYVMVGSKEQVLGFVVVKGEYSPLLDTIFLAPKYRNKRLGHDLLEHVQSRYKELYLYVACDNEIAKYTYEQHGFEIKARLPHYAGTGLDYYLMYWKEENAQA